jgi:hypothetical protein
VGKPIGKYALRRWRNNLEDNIKMYLTEFDCEDGKWMGLV